MNDEQGTSCATGGSCCKTSRWVWVLVLAGLAGAYLYTARPKPSAVTWSEDLDAGLARAAEKSQPVLIEFHATWCGVCKTMDREVFSQPSVADALKDWVLVRIDGDERPQMLERYRVDAYPTFIALAPSGEPLAMFVGSISPDGFIQWIRSARQGGEAS